MNLNTIKCIWDSVRTVLPVIGLVVFFSVACSTGDDDYPVPEVPEEPEDPEEPVILEKEITIGGKTYRIDSISLEVVHPGLAYKYIRVEDVSFPVIIHSMEWDTRKAGLRMETWLGNDSLRGKERPSAMVRRRSQAGENVMAAINGDFYDMSGVTSGIPLGGEMTNGVMTKSPASNEPILAFDKDNKPYMDYMALDASVKNSTNETFGINGINITRGTNMLILFNSYAGKSTRTNEWGEEVLLSPVNGNWEDLDHRNVSCRVESVVHSGEGKSMQIPKGKIVLSGHGTAATYLKKLKQGDILTIDIGLLFQTDQSRVQNIKNMIGSYSIILKEGEPSGPADYLSTTRHPRTSAGFSGDRNKIYFTVVDGRITASPGVTTRELADIMLHLGAANAVNLDGGGSSCLVAGDKIRNSLSDGSERAVANGLSIIQN